MENENPRVPTLWEHSLTTLLGHDPTSDPGIALRQWVHFQGDHPWTWILHIPSYQTYYELLINACVRYDKTKKANIGKRRNVYNANIDSTYVDYPTDVIDYVPESYHGGINLPPDVFYQIHALSSRHPPSPRPCNPSRPPFRPHSQQSGHQKCIKRYDGPIYLPPQIYKLLSQDGMKALKPYNTEAIYRYHQRKVHNTEDVEIPQDDPPKPSVPNNGPSDLSESDLDIPDGPILDFVNSQCHNSEHLDQALQAYEAYG